MVSITKYLLLGLGLAFAGFFFKEAAATSLTGTLSRTGLAGKNIGASAASIGTGFGQGLAGLFKPFWEIRNLIGSFWNLGNTSLSQQQTSGGGNVTGSMQGGGDIKAETPTYLFYENQQNKMIATNPATVPTSQQTIKWKSGITKTLPLSSAAVDYYKKLGVQVGGGANQNTGSGGGIQTTSAQTITASYRGGSVAASKAASALRAAAAAQRA